MDTIEIEQREARKHKVDIILLTGKNEHENEEIDKYIVPYKGSIYKFTGGTTGASYTIGYFGKYLVAHVRQKENGSYDKYASKAVVNEILSIWSEIKLIISVGIACGIGNEIGDVIISEKIIPCEQARISTAESSEDFYLEPRGNEYEINRDLLQAIKPHQWVKNNENKLVFGETICVEKLIDNTIYRDKLLEALKDRNIVGLEMEGSGIKDCISAQHQFSMLIIKGISDFGDGGINKNLSAKEIRQKLAAKNSSHFLYGLMNRDIIGTKLGIKIHKRVQTIDDTQINGIKMFYYRHYKQFTYEALAKLIENDKKKHEEIINKLRCFERVDVNDPQNTFKKTNYYWINKIEKNLRCQGELTAMSVSDKEMYFYSHYYGKHRLYPTTNVKAVVFDFDGTLTQKKNNRSSWERIWDFLGYNNNEAVSLYVKYKSGEITHSVWCSETAKYFIDKKLTKKQVENIGKQTTLFAGCRELFEFLYRNGIKIFICSGSIDTMISAALPHDLNKFITDKVSNVFVYDENGYLTQIVGTIYDFEGKREYLKKEVIRKYNFLPEEVAFVGNSDNDVWAYEAKVRTILINHFNVDPGNRKIWNYYIQNITNLQELIPFLTPIEEYLNKN